MIFFVDGGIERPVTPSRGPRDAEWIDMNILYYWAALLYGPKTKAPYDINYERKKKKKESKQYYEYKSYEAIPARTRDLLLLRLIERNVHMTPSEFHSTNWNEQKIQDSIKAVEIIKNHESSRIYFEESLKKR